MTKQKPDTEEIIEETIENQTETAENAVVNEEIAEETENSCEEKYAQLNDAHLRLMADFENFRKRTMREKADLFKSAGEKILVNILPLVDDFERGIKAAETAADLTAVREGMELIYNKFIDFLCQNGVKTIETDNQVFDVDFHDAVTTIPAPTEEQKGKIIDCVQKGYMLNDKVIRFPKVVVGE